MALRANDEFGAKAEEVVFDRTSTNETAYNYQFRMWVGEDYQESGGKEHFTLRVNVYGNDGVIVEVKRVELDKNSEMINLVSTMQ